MILMIFRLYVDGTEQDEFETDTDVANDLKTTEATFCQFYSL